MFPSLPHLPIIPVSYFTTSIALFCVAISTPRSKRWLPQIPTALCIWFSFTNSHHWPAPIDSLWGLMMTVWISHSTSVLWLVDWDAWWKEDTDCARDSGFCVCERHRRIWRLWNNPRLIGTPDQVRGAPKRSSTTSRLVFSRLAKLLAYWIIWNHVQPLIFPGLLKPIQVSEFDPVYESFVRRLLYPGTEAPVGSREFGMRSIWAVLWASGAAILIDAAHAILSIICVGLLRVDKAADWPPIFGPFAESYSIRRFWGQFWHKIIVQPYTQFGKLLSRRILGLRPRYAGDKVCVIFTIFFLSGVAHAAVAYQLGDRCGWTRDILWFSGNAVAGAVEMLAGAPLSRLAGRVGVGSQNRGIRKAIGFIWVFLFFFWSVPKWQYPKLRCAIEQELQRSRPVP